jgi:hypothetical protein
MIFFPSRGFVGTPAHFLIVNALGFTTACAVSKVGMSFGIITRSFRDI